MNGAEPPRTQFGDYSDVLRDTEGRPGPIVVGGQAANAWAIHYSKRIGRKLDRYRPFTSKDLDLAGDRDLLYRSIWQQHTSKQRSRASIPGGQLKDSLKQLVRISHGYGGINIGMSSISSALKPYWTSAPKVKLRWRRSALICWSAFLSSSLLTTWSLLLECFLPNRSSPQRPQTTPFTSQ